MNLRRIGRPLGLVPTTLLIVASSMASPAMAGNHHKTILVPVQTVSVQTTQVQAAAPVAYYQLQAAPAPVFQVAAPAPVFQVAAAPVAYYQVQAAPAPAAAAPMTYYQLQPAASPVKAAAAPVAAAPSSPSQVTYGGYVYNLAPGSKAAASPPAVGASPPGIDGLSDDDRKKILDRLAEFVTIYQKNIADTTIQRATIRSKASSIYADVTSNDPDSTEGSKTVDSLVAKALGETDASSTTPDPSTPTTTTQPTLIPVSAAPTTMQLFLPVKVKHHSLYYYR